VNLDTLLAKSDIITLHTPGGKDTKNLINAAAFAKCKQGVFLVNAGRGGVVNEADLLAALESGKVRAQMALPDAFVRALLTWHCWWAGLCELGCRCACSPVPGPHTGV
jgi:hypothetical protein